MLPILAAANRDATGVQYHRARYLSPGLGGQSLDQFGHAQWIGHVLNRLQLTDNSRRKHHIGGKVYAIDRREVLDMMQRYDVPLIEKGMAK